MKFMLVLVLMITIVSSQRPGPLLGQWAVELRGDGLTKSELEQKARVIAQENGLEYRGHVPGIGGLFHFTAPKSIANDSYEFTRSLTLNKEVKTVEQQKLLLRELKGFDDNHLLEKKPLNVSRWSYNQTKYLQQTRGTAFKWPTDPLWSRQWSLYNVGQSGGRSGLDLKVVPAWIQGYTGQGVVVSIVDDGLMINHPDLRNNFDSTGSLNIVDGSHDPSPASSHDNHGTRCAGVVAMERDNHYCGVGVAYQSTLAGIKFDLGEVTDLVESTMLSYRSDYISIYSCSWGPSDSGFTVAGPEKYTQSVLHQGVIEGRGGLGNIYVFASGNGGSNGDSCAADGYVNSIYTMAVGSGDQNGKQAFYDEDCSAKIAITYSFNSKTFDNAYVYEQLSTTSIDGGCTDSFTGTSASAPLMSAVTALVLQANPSLSWRDVQYIVTYTANPSPLKSSGDWKTNGAGLKFSHKFGFGAVDAEAMVTRAKFWIPVPEQQRCTIYPGTYGSASNGDPLKLSFSVDSNICSNIAFLEHVILTATIALDIGDYQSYYDGEYYEDPSVIEQSGPRRGDISLSLSSPAGTKSILLPLRSGDYVNNEGYYNWPFMSRHFWGESPSGTWTVTLLFSSAVGSVSLNQFYITLYGTSSTPKAVARIPNKCSSQCSRGCAAKGDSYCDSCKNYRLPSSLRCVTSCPTGHCSVSGYCVQCSPFQLSGLAITGIATGALAILTLVSTVLIYMLSRRCRTPSNYHTL